MDISNVLTEVTSQEPLASLDKKIRNRKPFTYFEHTPESRKLDFWNHCTKLNSDPEPNPYSLHIFIHHSLTAQSQEPVDPPHLLISSNSPDLIHLQAAPNDGAWDDTWDP